MGSTNCDLEIENCNFEILKGMFEPIEMVLSKSGPSKMKRTKQLLLMFFQIILTIKNHISYFTIRRSCKGQLSSKCPFGAFNSSKKTKEKIQHTVLLIPQVEFFLFVFWKK